MSNIAISIGSVPAKLDSVKYISNRFRGGLGLKVAKALYKQYNHRLTVFKWKYNLINTSYLNVIELEDVLDYKEKLLNYSADAYILSAAVANLMPVKAWEHKFPSHDYNVGDEFDIKFCIAPRIIDEVKQYHPRSTLIGYKLFDGTRDELIGAGRKILANSKANVVFANTPQDSKNNKYMLTQDMSVIPVSFDDHIDRINTLLTSNFYKTQVVDIGIVNKDELGLAGVYPRTTINGRIFGCFAVRETDGRFITTARDKSNGLVSIANVDHKRRTIYASDKATMNVPLLDMIFKMDRDVEIILHDHQILDNVPTYTYQSPGTDKEAELGMKFDPIFNIEGHGYIAKFGSMAQALEWIDEH